ASGVSPGATLPPGDSHSPPIAALSGRWTIRMRPFSQMMAAATTTTRSDGLELLKRLAAGFAVVDRAAERGAEGVFQHRVARVAVGALDQRLQADQRALRRRGEAGAFQPAAALLA